MGQTNPLRLEPKPDGIDLSNRDRTARAKMKPLVVMPRVDERGDAIGVYDVYSTSESHYVVDLPERACDCPDMEYNRGDALAEGGCYHLQRVSMMVERTCLPAYHPDTGGEAEDQYVETYLPDVKITLQSRIAAIGAEIATVEALTDTLGPATAEHHRARLEDAQATAEYLLKPVEDVLADYADRES